MGDMPEVIAKGPILEELDKVLNKRGNINGKPRRQVILDALKKDDPPEDLLTLAGKDPHKVKLNDGQKYHIKQHWLIDDQWLDQPVEPIVRQALITALGKAMEKNLDVDSYWVCHPGHGGSAEPILPEPLEVSVSWYGKQVTVIFHTPEPLYPLAGSTLMTPENIVVVKRGGSGDPVVVPVLHS
jgi:hypothetical protein